MIRTTALTTLLTVLAYPSWIHASVSTKDFKAEYRRILEVYASGGLGNAVSSLVKLEATAAGSRTLQFVESTEKGIVRDLANVDEEILVPVILLHRQSYFAYQRLGLFTMSIHSIAMAKDWADEYVDVTGSGMDGLSAADFLTNLADGVVPSEAASHLLYKALKLDPDHESALLALAKRYERLGDYKRATVSLSRLLRIRPEHEEGALRLAIHLVRSDRREEAAEIFQRVLDADVPDWIRSIAHQELARIHMEDGDLKLARKLLELGMKRFPSDPSLLISFVYISEREGATEGVGFTEAIGRCATDCGKSTRSIYTPNLSSLENVAQDVLSSVSAEYLERLKKAISETTSTKRGP